MINIVLFGAPGAGKGTQAGKLAAKYGFNHISTGDVIRQEIRDMTHLGLAVQEAIARGELAPDDVVIEIIDRYIRSNGDCSGNIFDGFPRTIPQAEALDAILDVHGRMIDLMLELVVPEEELVRRILLRGHDSCREDDSHEEIIRNRIEVYNAHTAIVAQYYREQGKYVAVDGCAPQSEVFDTLCREIDKLPVVI